MDAGRRASKLYALRRKYDALEVLLREQWELMDGPIAEELRAENADYYQVLANYGMTHDTLRETAFDQGFVRGQITKLGAWTH